MALSPHFQQLPKSIQNLLQYGIKLTGPQEIILFGSRARGDHHENSDYDIAFKALTKPKNWSRFLIDFEEEALTLQKIDILLYEEATDEYRKNIDNDGVLLYEN